ncbi:universal stress protein [Balneolales bacterium ANBcel1]|nr:universal stress protein [Balneolales bacterium ANBcel1]
MRKLNRILVPTDFSEGSRKAYSYAESLLKVFGGTVDMINVVPTIRYLHESMKKVGYPFSLDQDVYPHIEEETEERLRVELHNHITEKHRGEPVVRVGRRAYEVILQHASEQKYDLIVMGAQGTHADHITRGHVTEKVIRFSPIPVLSISGSVMPESTSTILVPTDYSDFSLKAILPASIMAGRLKAEITLFHVRELHGTEPVEESESDDEMLRTFRKKAAAKIEAFFAERPKARMKIINGEGDRYALHLEREEESYQIPLNFEMVRGISAHYEIVDYAEANADMIVIATHGRSGLAHIFMGSTSEKVVERAKIPVMTIRPKEVTKKQAT